MKKIFIYLLFLIAGFVIGFEIPTQDLPFKQIIYDIAYSPLSAVMILAIYTTVASLIQKNLYDNEKEKIKKLEEEVKKLKNN